MSKIHTYLLTKARKERRQNTRKVAGQVSGRIGWAFAAAVANTVIILMMILAWQYSILTTDLPSIEQIPAEVNAQSAIFTRPTRLLDASGTTVLAELTTPGIQRQYIRVKGIGGHVSEDYLNALITIIEPDFWKSAGYSWDISNPDEHPTIAQRLVFSLLLSHEKSSPQRAIRERILAAQLTARYGREKVLEWFINSLNNGNYAYGVEAAAQTYFGKSSSEITLPEAAILAGTAAAPALNPWDSPNGARALQIQVLQTMASRNMIKPAVAKVAVQVVVPFTNPNRHTIENNEAFLNLAMRQLEQTIGRDRMERGGLTIQTTLDADLQAELECAIQAQISAISGDEEANSAYMRTCPAARLLPLLPPGETVPRDRLTASVMVMDPVDARVSAYISRLKYGSSTTASAVHPAGSVLYPSIYLNAFTQGFAPASLVWDVPPDNQENTRGDQTFAGPVNIRTALIHNDKAPIEQILGKVGTSSYLRFLDAAGINISGDISDGIESLQVSELQVTSLYNLFASGGYLRGGQNSSGDTPQPVFIQKIWDANNQVIYEYGSVAEVSVVSPQAAYLLTSILSDQIMRGQIPGLAPILETSRDSAVLVDITGKNSQAWVVGYTPQLTIMTWMGIDPVHEETEQIDPRWVSGLWRSVMLTGMKDLEDVAFVEPAGIARVQVCVPSGDLPSAECPQIQEDVFLFGNEPKTIDSLYKKFAVNAETGKLATVFTPENLVVEKVFLNPAVEFRDWAKKVGLPIPPFDYDVVRSAQIDPAVHLSTPKMFDITKGTVVINGSASMKDFEVYRLHYGTGLNPAAWQQIGQDGFRPVVEDTLGEWNTNGVNGLVVLRLQVVDSSQVVKNAYTQIVVDNTKPSVEIVHPAADVSMLISTDPSIFIRAEAEDNIGLREVRFVMDGAVVSSLTEMPYAVNWKTTIGDHKVVVEAVDTAGNITISEPLQIRVK